MPVAISRFRRCIMAARRWKKCALQGSERGVVQEEELKNPPDGKEDT
jgi:hypothetical protein